jgi:hypothetical protein
LEEATLEDFIRAWNEPDPATRRGLLEKVWAEDGRFFDSQGKIEGRTALDTHIGALLERWPQRRLASKGWLERMGGRAGFRWALRSAEGSEVQGYALTEVDDEGRLTDVVCFDEPSAAPPEPKALPRIRSWALANPLSIASLGLLALYLALRFQTERFYDSFGVSPEEVGFGSVELVIRQATDVLAEFAKIGLFWAIGYLAGMLPFIYLLRVRKDLDRRDRKYLVPLTLLLSVIAASLITFGLYVEWLWAIPGLTLLAILLLLPRFLYPEGTKARAEARSSLMSWSMLALALGIFGYGSWVFLFSGLEEASSDSQWVKEGGWVTDSNFPWRARPVEVAWSIKPRPFPLPDCRNLVYLGEANGWIVLYDRMKNHPLRLMESDVDLSLPENGCDE